MDMQVERGEPEDSFGHLENFDVGSAIKIVREYGEILIDASANAKHNFGMEWVD